MLPVSWKQGWPHILPPDMSVPLQAAKPGLESTIKNISPQTGNFVWRDEFDQQELQLHWVKARTSPVSWHRIDKQKNVLQLLAQTYTLSEKVQPSYLGRRQQHQNFSARTELLLPDTEGLTTGLALFQNSGYHYFLGVKKQDGKYSLQLEETLAGKTTVTREKTLNISEPHLILGAAQESASLKFFYVDAAGRRQPFVENIPASNISTQTAGGFVGVTMGPHARQDKADNAAEK